MSNILCLNTKVMLPNIKEKVEMNSKSSFLVEKVVKQTIVVVLEILRLLVIVVRILLNTASIFLFLGFIVFNLCFNVFVIYHLERHFSVYVLQCSHHDCLFTQGSV